MSTKNVTSTALFCKGTAKAISPFNRIPIKDKAQATRKDAGVNGRFSMPKNKI
jgi:hypothetical protein